MEVIRYRRRSVTEQDIATIREIITSHPEKSRRFISQEVCRVWNWRQQNGALKDMVCRSLLLLLEEKGLIKQPPRKSVPHNPLANRKKPAWVAVDQTPVKSLLKDLMPVRLVQVRKTSFENTFNSLISEHHYLGYTQPVGEHLKYIAFSQNRPIACLAWSSAPWYIGARDRFIGWPPEVRKKNLHLIAYQSRFLILPWVQVPNLASYLLALNRKCVSLEWMRIYYHPVRLVETFVDTSHFIGACYRADNWIHVGETTGLGKLSKSKKPTLSKKAVYLYPLTRNFRRELCNETY